MIKRESYHITFFTRPIIALHCWPFLFFLFFFKSTPAFGSEMDSLTNLLKISRNDTVKVELLNALAYDCLQNNLNDKKNKASYYADSAVILAQRIGFRAGLARAYYLKGKTFLGLNPSFENANAIFLKSLAIYDELKDIKGIADCNLQLGIISYSLRNFSDARLHLLKSLDNNDKNSMTTVIGHYLLGICYGEMDSIIPALRHFNVALAWYQAHNDTDGIIQSYTYLGKMYINAEDYNQAVHQLEKVIRFGKEKGISVTEISLAYAFLSTAYLRLNKTEQCIYYGELAKKSLDFWIIKKEVLASLSEAYSRKGEYHKAYDYLKSLQMLTDSIYNSNIVKGIAELRSKFDFEKRLSEQKTKQEKIAAQQKSDIENQKLIKNAILFSSILFIILLLLLLNRFRLKQKHSEELAIAFDNLKLTQEKLIEQEKLASLGALTAGIAHEIKNPLNFVNNFSDLSQELVQEFKETTNKQEQDEILNILVLNLKKIQHHGLRADRIVQSMMLHARGRSSEKQITDINSLCDEVIELTTHGMRANIKAQGCEIKKIFEQAIPEININKQDIGRVILNLLNNAIYAVGQRNAMENTGNANNKKNKYQPLVVISTLRKDQNIVIVIRDNGIGIPVEIRKKIFEPFFTTKPSGVGTGLGMSLSYDIVKAHGGDIAVDSNLNEFTEFTIVLPLKEE